VCQDILQCSASEHLGLFGTELRHPTAPSRLREPCRRQSALEHFTKHLVGVDQVGSSGAWKPEAPGTDTTIDSVTSSARRATLSSP